MTPRPVTTDAHDERRVAEFDAVRELDIAKVFLTLERIELTETALEQLIIWLDDEYGVEDVKG